MAGSRNEVSTTSAPLFIQQLSGSDQTLVLLHMVTLRAASRAATTGALLDLIDALRLPRPANISTTLSRLGRKNLVRRAGKMWQITPLGEAAVAELVARVPADTVVPAAPGAVGSPFGEERQDVVPFWYAPDNLRRAVARLLSANSFDSNVLLITRFPRAEDPDDPLHDAITVTAEALTKHGLVLRMASDANADDGLHGNVIAHMWAARYGIAFLEQRTPRGLVGNVIAELGAMAMTGRRCALLRDTTADDLPSDLLDRLYRPIDLDKIETVTNQVHRFVRDDLRLPPCPDCPSGR
jgi:hypothetical protein